jgi:ribose transport system ATP-binding protein
MAEALTPRFEMRGISKAFDATQALKDVDLHVMSGEVCALVGQNGAGKSTLMSILSGALRPDRGTMSLDGIAYHPRDPLAARRAGVAMIYQELSLAPHLSVEENIVLGVEPTRRGFIDRVEMRRIAEAALERLNHPEIHPSTLTLELSIAEQQLVEIARALAVGCRVLVLEEPTSSVSRSDAERLFDIVRHLKQQGHAIVYISHFIDEVKAVADRFVVLRDGRNAGCGSVAATSREQIVEMMVGRSVKDLYPRTRRQPGETLLQFESITLRRGEIIGIAGLVGAGRTRLLRRILQSGRQGLNIGMLSEDRKNEGLAIGMSIADNITLPRLPRWIRPAQQAADSERWIQRLEIRCRDGRQMVSALSGGNQQKVAFARLLHCDVDVLLLDEPTRGIDVASKAQIYELIDQLVAAGKGVLIVSSYFPEVVAICDLLAVMHRGRLGRLRPIHEIDEHQLMLEAAAGAAEG